MTLTLSTLHQVAGRLQDLPSTRAFYTDILGAHFLAEFDPPGLLFFDFGGTRLLLERDNTPATLYLWVDDIDDACGQLQAHGVALETAPHLIHKDEAGTFGPAGAEEWMAFFKDPSDNTLVLATRR